jgi:ABC-type iron transport system FetAB ATPase subunit
MKCLTVKQLSTAVFTCAELNLCAGECVGLSGPSGSGKTLLLRAIADLDLHQGSILLDEDAQQDVAPTDWRRRIAYVPTDSGWWADRVGQHFDRDADALIKRLGLDRECLSWPVSQLSSGERQRLAIARALLQEPEVLLLDEPTSNQDRDNTARIERLIEEYRHQREAGVLWVSHDAEQRGRVASRSYQIEAGQVTGPD